MEAMAMNFNKRKEPRVEPITPDRTPFRLPPNMEEEIVRDTHLENTPRLSEFAPDREPPVPLRDRIEQASRMSLQEAADACNAMITDMLEMVKAADVKHTQMHRSSENMVNTVHEALKRHQAEIVRHSEHMSRICEVTEMVRNETAPKPDHEAPQS
jgi:hypothetical protein